MESQQMEKQIRQLTEERDRLKRELRGKEIELNNKQGHINSLLESERELQHIKNSHSWKVLSRWWRFRDRLIPEKSKRWMALKMTAAFVRHPLLFIRKQDNWHQDRYESMSNESSVSTGTESGNLVGKTDEIMPPDQLPIENFENIEAVPELHMPCSFHPMVSIVIPVYNQFSYTYACLQSIAKNSGDIPYEVIIADDCSDDLTRDLQRRVTGIHVIRNQKNLRFLRNCNHAASQAKGKYILFLNNDTQVGVNWLKPLVELIESKENIGMVGSKLIYPDGHLQEAGGILWKDGSAWNYGYRQDPALPEYNYVKETDYISGAAIMIQADLWRQLGGFDELFAPAYCEDSDLAFQVRKAGYQVMFQPKSVVIHFEGISNGTDLNAGQKAYQTENQKKFYEKWKDMLEKEHNPNGVNPFLAKDRSLHKKTILFVDHYVPQFDKDAGSRTVFAYVRMFVHAGFNVKFIGDNFFPHEPYTSILQQMGVEVLYGTWYSLHWKEWLEENAASFDYAFLNRPHIAVKYIDLIREKSNAHILYYGHDLHFLRVSREHEVTGNPELLQEAESWKQKEFALMQKADLAAYPSEAEIEEIHRVDPSIPAVAITPYFYDPMPEQDYYLKNRRDLFFIGGFNHGPNVDAVKWIATDIMPLLRAKGLGIRVHIAGSNMPPELMALQDEDIIMEGQLSDEELRQFYRSSRINLIPLRYGAGIKGKVVESMRYGLPVITTTCGAEGILNADHILQIADTAEAIVEKISSLYEDEPALQAISSAGIQYANMHYTEARARQILNEVYHFDEGNRKRDK